MNSFVVIDCETTGLGRHDRIVEIAALTLDPKTWELVDEYDTLINPERDLGPVGLLEEGALRASVNPEELTNLGLSCLSIVALVVPPGVLANAGSQRLDLPGYLLRVHLRVLSAQLLGLVRGYVRRRSGPRRDLPAADGERWCPARVRPSQGNLEPDTDLL